MSPSSNSTHGQYREKYRPALDQCQQMVTSRIHDLTGEMFAHAEPTLHGWAEQTNNDIEKNQYYQASTFLQKQQPIIDDVFDKELKRGFTEFWDPSSAESDPDGYSLDSSLMLIGDDSMEESVIISNADRRANDFLRQPLYDLRQRLGVMRGGTKVSREQTPGGPDQLTAAFNQSLNAADAVVSLKKIIFRLFEQSVLQQLSSVYKQYNAILREAGVLPNLSPEIQNLDSLRNSQGMSTGTHQDEPESELTFQSAKHSSDASAAMSGQSDTPSFNGLFHLMSQSIGLTGGSGRAPGGTQPALTGLIQVGLSATGGNTVTGEGAPDILDAALSSAQQSQVQPLTSQQLIDALAKASLPEQISSDISGIEDFFKLPDIEFADAYLGGISRTLKQERHRTYRQLPLDRIKVADAAAIELIGKLFQEVLAEPLLPMTAKTQICNLHIPYLKMAVLDHGLFTDDHHIARQLLDKMVFAAGIWVNEDDLKQGIYPDLQQIVDRILREFSEDTGLFEELLEYLSQRIEHFELGSRAIEKRTRNAARGRERLEIARKEALKEIRQRITTPLLHPDVVSFLINVWTDRLIFILLQKPDKRDWRDALGLMDDLIRLFDPNHRSATTDDDIRELRQNLEAGLQQLGNQRREQNHPLLELLTTPETVSSAIQSAVEKPSSMNLDELDSSSMLSAQQSQASAEERELIDRLRETGIGIWFLMRDEMIGDIKGKLSWISPITSNCIFVDGSGEQNRERPLHKLANEIVTGNTSMIDPDRTPFSTRALVEIQQQLQNSAQ